MFPVTEVKLNQNIITKALFNMIISQHVFGGNVASTELADMFKVDGTLYGDTKLYHSFDIGSPEDWGNDEEAANLLALNRNRSGKTQSIKMGVYKMIWVTIDRYLSKQAFMAEGSFAEYISFLTGSLRKIKKVYDRCLINVEVGTLKPSTDRCKITITTPKGTTQEETNRLAAQTIAAKIVVLKADLEDNNRDFNSLGYLRSYSPENMIAIWNVEQHAKITKLDLPTIFHNDGVDRGGFREINIPAKWFGDRATGDLTLAESSGEVGKERILVSGWYDVSQTKAAIVSKPTDKAVYLWAGDKVPYKGQVYHDNARDKDITVLSTTLDKAHYYTENPDIAFVLVSKEALPYMSGFETGTEFWNPRSLTSNHYLIYGHNELEWIEEYPRIQVTVKQAS